MARKTIKTRKGTTSEDMVLGLRIRALRLDRKASQQSLANALGLSFQQVQKYEKGINHISVMRALEIARFFRIDLATLVGNGALEKDALAGFDNEAYKLALEFRGLPDHVKTRMRALARAIIDGE